MVDITHKDILAAPVFEAYAKARGFEPFSNGNLFVHQFQVALYAMLAEFPPIGYTPSANIVASEDCFKWTWESEASTELESYARKLYIWAIGRGCNHAQVHVAIAALIQLGRLCGEHWDVSNLNGYPCGD